MPRKIQSRTKAVLITALLFSFVVLSASPEVLAGPSIPPGVLVYVPVTLTNAQSSATPSNFQQKLTLDWNTYGAYLNSGVQNVEFFDGSGTILKGWCESSCSSSSTSSVVWVNLGSDTIVAGGGTLTIYIGFLSTATNNMGNIGTSVWGEAPQLSGTYGQYDDGANVFVSYYRGDSTSGWTISGTAGSTLSAPTGSASGFGTKAFYANSASGDYMNTNAGYSTTGDYIVQYYTYTTGLGNLFFSASAGGAGTIARLDSRGGGNYVGLAKSASWTHWNCPESGLTLSADTWYQWSIVLAGGGTQVGDFYTTSFGLGTLGAQINALGTTYTDGCGGGAETYAPQGSYIGLVGDALGSAYITYWNGIVIRAYPPAGVMPSVSFSGLGFAAAEAPTVSLSSYVNQDLGVLIPGSTSLTPSMNPGEGVAGSAVFSLVSTVNEGLGVSPSAAISLASNLLVSGFNVLQNASSTISSSVNQDLGVASALSEALIPTVTQDLGSALSVATSLVSTLGQDPGAVLSRAVQLTPIIDISEFSSSLGVFVNLSSTLNQQLGLGMSAAVKLLANLGNVLFRHFSADIAVMQRITATLNQGLGGLASSLSATLSLLVSTISSLSDHLRTALSMSVVLNQGLGAAVSATSSLASIIVILLSQLTSTTTTGTGHLLPVPFPLVGLLLIIGIVAVLFFIVAYRRRKKEDEEDLTLTRAGPTPET